MLPVFALANAGVVLSADVLDGHGRLVLAIMAGSGAGQAARPHRGVGAGGPVRARREARRLFVATARRAPGLSRASASPCRSLSPARRSRPRAISPRRRSRSFWPPCISGIGRHAHPLARQIAWRGGRDGIACLRGRHGYRTVFFSSSRGVSGSGMNSSASPGTVSKRPAFHSALACSMRSFREETKFHQM